MTIVPPAVVDESTLYVSVHIPKTAGTTLRHALRSIFADRLQEAYLDHPATAAIADPRCIHGHDLIPMFGDRIRRHPKTYWFTFLREPLQKAISLYYHVKRNPQDSLFHDRGLEHWLTHHEEYRWPDPPCYSHNHYWWWLALGRPQVEQYQFIGVTERLDESMFLLAHHRGWPLPVYTADNLRPEPPIRVAESIVRRFKELNPDDYQRYAEACQQLDRTRAAYGDAFADDFEVFRRGLHA